MKGQTWTTEEISAIVNVYFEMLFLELSGRSYNKREYNRQLQNIINRTPGSIEYKFQNISAVLIKHHFPYIDGYKPAWNYQNLLEKVVVPHIMGNNEISSYLLKEEHAEYKSTFFSDNSDIFRSPPEFGFQGKVSNNMPRTYKGVVIDFVKLDAENRSLGKAGEKFIAEFEAKRLWDIGKKKLSQRVELVSETKGDGIGYDILSFEENGTERFIEVKTTNRGKYFPFYTSINEVDFSDDFSSQYHLYRLYKFKEKPQFYELQGSLRQFNLEPVTFRLKAQA
jgi:hypothetical protein